MELQTAASRVVTASRGHSRDDLCPPSWGRMPLALACLLAVFCDSAPATYEPPVELTVVTDVNYPPYLYRTEDGELQGIVADKWALWSRRTGIKVRVEGMRWADAQQSVQNGSKDVLEAVAYTDARAALYEFSPPYAQVEARVYVHHSIKGIVASMRGFAIGAKDGSACGAWLARHGIDTLRNYASSEALVKAAGAGDVRLFCMDSTVAQYFLFKTGLAADFLESPPIYTTQFHWAVKKGRSELRDFIQQGFAAIGPADLAAIDRRWLGNPLQFPLSQRFLAYLGAAFAAILGAAVLLIGWNRMLRRRVNERTAELHAALASTQRDAMRIQDLYNNAPCGYHSLDAEGVFVSINDTELAWLGRTREELVGQRKFSDFMTAEGRAAFAGNYPRFLAKGEIRDVEYDLVRKNGSVMSILLSATMLRDAGGGIVMSRATLHDITERKRAEDAVRRLNAELEQRIEHRTADLLTANKELEAFSYSLSHDLRAPLRSIDGFSHLLLDGYADTIDERGRNYLERVRRASQRIGVLIDDMLKLSRVSFADLAVADIDMTALAAEIAGELAHAHPARQVEVSVGSGMVARGDRGLVRILLGNLLDNAWKYTVRNPAARIEVGVSPAHTENVFFIRDNGVGFDMDYAGKLFVPFQRLHDSREFDGTGIGLATVQRVTNRHRGRIWVESEVDCGTTVFFTLGI
jgi:PAS domain S-box-containing protein